jgi:hypothetical protein
VGRPRWGSQASICGRGRSHIDCACSSDDSGSLSPMCLVHIIVIQGGSIVESDATSTSSD